MTSTQHTKSTAKLFTSQTNAHTNDLYVLCMLKWYILYTYAVNEKLCTHFISLKFLIPKQEALTRLNKK
jgi:hypothetical protein